MSSKQRLALFKARAAKSTHNINWRQHRYGHTFKTYDKTSWSQDGKTLYADKVNSYGTKVGDCHELVRMNHKGWYCDNIQSETCIGAVVKMHTSQGTWYVPVTHTTGYDGAVYYMDDIVKVDKQTHDHDQAIRDCARISDRLAQIVAEHERENDALLQAEIEVENLKEEIKLKRAKIKSLIGAVRHSEPLDTTICEFLKDSIRELLEKCREDFRRIQAVKDDPFLAA